MGFVLLDTVVVALRVFLGLAPTSAPPGDSRLEKEKECFNTSFGIATYRAVESPGPFTVSFGHVEDNSNTCMCGDGKSKRPHDDQKWRCSGAETKGYGAG